MPPDQDIFSELLTRLRKLPNADRKAVLSQLSLEQRLLVEQKLRSLHSRGEIEDEAATASGKRYALYSPNLARLLAAIETGGSQASVNGLMPTAAVCSAVLSSVKEIEDQLALDAPVQPPPVLHMLRDLFFKKIQKA